MERKEAKNRDITQLVLECGDLLFVIEANIVAEVSGILVGDTLHFRRVDLLKGSRHSAMRVGYTPVPMLRN